VRRCLHCRAPPGAMDMAKRTKHLNAGHGAILRVLLWRTLFTKRSLTAATWNSRTTTRTALAGIDDDSSPTPLTQTKLRDSSALTLRVSCFVSKQWITQLQQAWKRTQHYPSLPELNLHPPEQISEHQPRNSLPAFMKHARSPYKKIII
jgi:hypothetical protein